MKNDLSSCDCLTGSNKEQRVSEGFVFSVILTQKNKQYKMPQCSVTPKIFLGILTVLFWVSLFSFGCEHQTLNSVTVQICSLTTSHGDMELETISFVILWSFLIGYYALTLHSTFVQCPSLHPNFLASNLRTHNLLTLCYVYCQALQPFAWCLRKI